MGSPLSPILANLFMEDFETKALALSPLKPNLWRRYVDDTFNIWPHGEEALDSFLQHLNSLHPSIQFTMEKQDEHQSLAFLDILLTKTESGTLAHSVYRKPTHTDRYLNYRSFHHPKIKSSVCNSLIRRAHSICDDEHLNGELTHLRNVLQQNGYPSKNIKLSLPQPRTRPSEQQAKQSVYLPYMGPVSHTLERILSESAIKVYYTTPNKLHQQLYTHKDKTERNLLPGIYRIPCECGLVYIGETGRNLSVRLKEHLACCSKGQTEKSSVAKHTWTTDHRILWKETSLICQESNYFARRVRESVEIHKHRTIEQEGQQLNDTWTALLKTNH